MDQPNVPIQVYERVQSSLTQSSAIDKTMARYAGVSYINTSGLNKSFDSMPRGCTSKMMMGTDSSMLESHSPAPQRVNQEAILEQN